MTEEDPTPTTYEGRYAPRRMRVLALAGGTVAFLVLGMPMAVYGALAGFMSDTCGLGDDSLICTSTGQGLTIVFSYGALAIGFLLTTLGGGWAVWRRRSLVPWLLSAWALLPVGMLASWSIGLRWFG